MPSEMEDDTHLTLSEIHRGNPAALVEQMMGVQRAILDGGAVAWDGRLRLLDISAVGGQGRGPDRRRYRSTLGGTSSYPSRMSSYHSRTRPRASWPPRRILPLRDHTDPPYVAISWRWSNNTPPSRYRVRRPREIPHRSAVPDLVFNRAISFAQANDISFLWIDKECIYQEDKKDKDKWVQVMDQIYRGSKISLGLLSVEIQSQLHLDSLSDLLRDRLYHTREKPTFRSWVGNEVISRTEEVLRLVLSDERWERTWIFQEDHCASTGMRLLIRHDRSLSKDRNLFGDIHGELDIACHEFRKAVTRFALACRAGGREFPSDMLAKVRQYNIWNGTGVGPRIGGSQGSTYNDELPRLPTSSLSILRDIKERKNKNVEDRLVIFANCCRYLTRLGAEYLIESRYGLSTCILCLYLLNGEVFSLENWKSRDSQDLLNHSVYDLLERISFKFDPPKDRFRTSHIDNYFRFSQVEFTREGVQTVGWLWEVGSAIKFTDRDLSCLEDEYPSDENELDILRNWLRQLGHRNLASKLPESLTREGHSDRGTSKPFITENVSAVIDGLRQHKPLRLARIYGETEVLGIFVGGVSKPATMCFTSYVAEDQKLVSIEVRHGGTLGDGRERLYARSWVNGAWFSYGKQKKTCVFPWSFVDGGEGKGL
ncbi:MAG: hypothetical protein M1840_008320 [Geoglossum simile]|nr:MAG: hypothetical protein M1840_008320 [Geoglossum simile]